MKKVFAYLFLVALLINSCGEPVYLPKPRGFHKIELPQHEYETLPLGYPYSFEYSKHSQVIPDSSFMTEKYWIEVYYPEYDARLTISYKAVNNNIDSLVELSNDSHRLTTKHHVKATAIDDYVTKTPNGITAVVFELEGDVPSQFQFYATDSTENFFRAALYFPTATKNDSLKPIIEYVKIDMVHMLNTLKWQDVNAIKLDREK
ncbi:MAG: gliding motility lipoprotein GldD [Flammeovirgaceae bacterium]|nr:gliding motility lipoprotein GldD [Flammeovirgaceae bacterium]